MESAGDDEQLLVHGANMGSPSQRPALSATLNPKDLQSADRALQTVESEQAARRRPHTAVQQRARVACSAGSSLHSSDCRSDETLGGIGDRNAGRQLDGTLLQNLRENLMDSMPKTSSPIRGTRREELRARLNNSPSLSPSRNPVAERRFPGRSIAGGGTAAGTSIEQTPEPRGRVGIQNLGNTCFINTCVQCLNSLTPFSNFFLMNQHIFHLNKISSMKGTLGLSFGELLHKLRNSKAFSSVSATSLRERVGKFAPQFTGFRQHDCQELLRFLLDGLHEDLRTSDSADLLTCLPYSLDSDNENAAAAHASMIQVTPGCGLPIAGCGLRVQGLTCVVCKLSICAYRGVGRLLYAHEGVGACRLDTTHALVMRTHTHTIRTSACMHA